MISSTTCLLCLVVAFALAFMGVRTRNLVHILPRHGLEWLLGLIRVSREHVILAPGEMGDMSWSIKASNNAHASYFTLTAHPLSGGDGNRRVGRLPERQSLLRTRMASRSFTRMALAMA
jgi:hypothetical protein